MNIKTEHIKFVIVLQKFFKNRLRIIHKFNNDHVFLSTLIEESSSKLIHIYNRHLITIEEYKKYMMKLSNISKKLITIPPQLSIIPLNNVYKCALNIKFSIIRLNLIHILMKVGCIDIINITKLFINKDLDEIGTYKFKEYITLYNNIFNAKSIDIYKSNNINNISFTSYNSNSTITLMTSQLHKPSFIDYKTTTNNLLLKIYGAKLYIPYKDLLIIVTGYFIKDNFNLYKEHPILKKTYTSLCNITNTIDIPKNFIKNYIQTIPLKPLFIRSNKQIIEQIMEDYLFLTTIKNKNISNLVKEFLIANSYKQYLYIYILTLDKNNEDSNYIAYLLYDLIYSNNSMAYSKNKSATIYDALPWSIQKTIKNSDKIIAKNISKINDFDVNDIPYEQRIILMKTSNEIKNKALMKLKEIKSGKNGEINSKAQQYLDGLLKIPFGVYKEPSILSHKQKYTSVIINYKRTILEHLLEVEETYKLDNDSLHIIGNIRTTLSSIHKKINICNVQQFTKSLKTLYSTLFEHKNKINTHHNNVTNQNINIKNLKTFTSKTLKQTCSILHISQTGKKTILINKIVKEMCLNYNHLFHIINITVYTQILKHLSDILTQLQSYYKHQTLYLQNVTKLLNQNIYGLDTPKRQIKRVIAQWISGKNNGHIVGLEGPPGTGKTTLAKYGIGNCLQDSDNQTRPFVFIPLGGSCNGSTLEGHSYTYVGSTWGKIIDSLITTKCMNPIIYIDELDKVSKTDHGKEIIGILTHLTDSTQNQEFNDKYFSGIPVDISKCLIIFSYNNADLIDKILLDRIHTIKIDPISGKDKIHITKLHLLSEIYENVGIHSSDIVLTDEMIEYIIQTYTYEAGARKLKEKLYQIMREVNLQILTNELQLPFTITKNFVDTLFKDNLKVHIKKINDTSKVGIVNGLYATSLGIGGITVIQIKKIFSKNVLDLLLTGNQGDIMKESMKVAKTVCLNYINSYYSDIEINTLEYGLHIHCPNGGTPKDGPSAGSGITLAIISFITNKKIRNDFAITGEIDLDGNVIQIGGLHSKLNGAKAAGVQTVLCPKMNEPDYENIITKDPTLIDSSFKVIFIKNIKEVVDLMLIP